MTKVNIIIHLRVWWASVTNNKHGKMKDVHGRHYSSVYKKFGLCRICFRELALQGQIPGVTKASW